jgi:hypothetical protein
VKIKASEILLKSESILSPLNLIIMRYVEVVEKAMTRTVILPELIVILKSRSACQKILSESGLETRYQALVDSNDAFYSTMVSWAVCVLNEHLLSKQHVIHGRVAWV